MLIRFSNLESANKRRSRLVLDLGHQNRKIGLGVGIFLWDILVHARVEGVCAVEDELLISR